MKISYPVLVDEQDVREYSISHGDSNPSYLIDEHVENDETPFDELRVPQPILVAYLNGCVNKLGHRNKLDAETLVVEMNLTFFEPIPMGQRVMVSAEVDEETVPDEPMSEVSVRAWKPTDHDHEYCKGSMMVMYDQDIPRDHNI